MLGHQFFSCWQENHDVKVTLRENIEDYNIFGLFNNLNSYARVNVNDTLRLNKVLQDFQPEAVINATGITKQRVDASMTSSTIAVNALFPHVLAQLCKDCGARLIQLSSDCIFSGRDGNYNENSQSDAIDLYGKSKYLGEVTQPHVITLRKSTIGLELAGEHGLLEWFLAKKGTVLGYRKAIYSGVSSIELARIIENILLNFPKLSGIWNIASSPINKYDLLIGLRKHLGRKDINIQPHDDFICDRSLNASMFMKKTGYIVPSWSSMLEELAEQIRVRNHV